MLMHKLCGGKVPKLHMDVLDEKDKQIIADMEAAKGRVQTALKLPVPGCLYEVIDLSRKGNKYMQEKEPWIVAKQLGEDPGAQKSIDNCLHLCLQLTANLAILINPFLPATAKKMLHMMKVVDKMLDWENAGKINLLSVGYSLRAPEILFRKIEDVEIAAQIEKLKAGSIALQASAEATPVTKEVISHIKPEIQFDDFAKIDLRTGTVLSAEKVQKADKLLKLKLILVLKNVPLFRVLPCIFHWKKSLVKSGSSGQSCAKENAWYCKQWNDIDGGRCSR